MNERNTLLINECHEGCEWVLCVYNTRVDKSFIDDRGKCNYKDMLELGYNIQHSQNCHVHVDPLLQDTEFQHCARGMNWKILKPKAGDFDYVGFICNIQAP